MTYTIDVLRTLFRSCAPGQSMLVTATDDYGAAVQGSVAAVADKVSVRNYDGRLVEVESVSITFVDVTPAQAVALPVQPPVVVNIVNQQGVGMPAVAITRQPKHTSHGLHLFLTIVTGGAWGVFVWLPLTLWHKLGPGRTTVTHYR
ncbi:hypothetical protein [Actinocrispum wychmicini]|uniref:Uncharacterized protein n=1 Tax=Actinocrispum wychmicini TaxID=1213861 RepID=A0A4R2JLH7_9PSEU|nr:hypothetical protein [Actinocrispum wychmicini]TCO60913.1 hypothetical protein EV192_103495 [Actinocrispum wychmicini]